MEVKPTDLVKIIEACGKTGVSSFKMGEIEINFNGFVIQTESDYPKQVEGVDKITQVDPNFQNQQEFEEGLEDDAELMILHPSLYEEQLLKGNLEDNEDG